MSCRVLWGRSGPSGSRLVPLTSSILPGREAREGHDHQLVSCFRQIGEGTESSLLLLSCLPFKTSLSQGQVRRPLCCPPGRACGAAAQGGRQHMGGRAPVWRPFPQHGTPPCCPHSLALLLPQPLPQKQPIPGFRSGSFQERDVNTEMRRPVLVSAPPTCTQSPQASSAPAFRCGGPVEPLVYGESSRLFPLSGC